MRSERARFLDRGERRASDESSPFSALGKTGAVSRPLPQVRNLTCPAVVTNMNRGELVARLTNNLAKSKSAEDAAPRGSLRRTASFPSGGQRSAEGELDSPLEVSRLRR